MIYNKEAIDLFDSKIEMLSNKIEFSQRFIDRNRDKEEVKEELRDTEKMISIFKDVISMYKYAISLLSNVHIVAHTQDCQDYNEYDVLFNEKHAKDRSIERINDLLKKTRIEDEYSRSEGEIYFLDSYGASHKITYDKPE